MALKIVTKPVGFPVSLSEAKAHLREDSSDFDDQINAFIEAATQYVDGPKGFLGRAILEQTWDYYTDSFNDAIVTASGKSYIELPLPPVIEVVSVNYVDSSGAEQVVDSSSYVVDLASQPARIFLAESGTWPTTADQLGAVRIRIRCGYVDSTQSPPVSDVPGPIKVAILLTLGTMYENRENFVVGTIVNKLPFAAEQLLRPYRVYLSMA